MLTGILPKADANIHRYKSSYFDGNIKAWELQSRCPGVSYMYSDILNGPTLSNSLFKQNEWVIKAGTPNWFSSQLKALFFFQVELRAPLHEMV